jgi:lipoyl(octanoyl) transferase
LGVVHLPGLTDYAAALEWQRALAAARADGALAHDLLLLLQHPPVITLGRGSHDENVVADREALRARGVEVFDVERGGDVTYHGPGQLVGYPILDLEGHRKDLHWYLRRVEEALIRACGELEIAATRSPGYTGVWVDAAPPRKIASIGVHVARWVTRHGFALNVTTDLSAFDLIIPCGIPQVRMTSVERETDRSPDWNAVADAVTDAFGAAFGLRPQTVAADSLPVPLPLPAAPRRVGEPPHTADDVSAGTSPAKPTAR